MTFLFRGRRNFDNCEHKTIERRTNVRPLTDGPVYESRLDCPNREGSRISMGGLERARDYETSDRLLRQCAATVCRNCIFAPMDAEEVVQWQEDNPLSPEEVRTQRIIEVLRNTID